jgi:hypothetical protein
MNMTGNATVDAVIFTATAAQQQACNAAGARQATCNSAYITMYRAILAAKIAASPALDVSNEISALQDQLGVTV